MTKSYNCPESMEELENLEALIPMCRKELYKQVEARIKTGAAKSISEASRQLAEETGRDPESIRRRVREEQGGHPAHLADLAETNKYKPKFLLDTAENRQEIVKEFQQEKKEEKELKRQEIINNLENIEVKEAKAIEGVYDVAVIDPPWEMNKIERDVAPNQMLFDYPTMTIEEISNIKIPAANDCHLFLWTTHKHLPYAFDILKSWGFKYICNFVWHKNGGFQPFNLPQYNCEFVLYAHKGNPQFIDTKDFFTCFNAGRTGHSKKPNEFYDTVKRVTAGRRIDMFARKDREGFDIWGNEVGQ